MNRQYASSLLTRKPQFSYNQQVCFIGGMGTVKDCCFDAGKWIYTIEMPLGPEPEMGRIGPETQILLEEIEIQEVSEGFGVRDWGRTLRMNSGDWNEDTDRSSRRSRGSRF